MYTWRGRAHTYSTSTSILGIARDHEYRSSPSWRVLCHTLLAGGDFFWFPMIMTLCWTSLTDNAGWRLPTLNICHLVLLRYFQGPFYVALQSYATWEWLHHVLPNTFRSFPTPQRYELSLIFIQVVVAWGVGTIFSKFLLCHRCPACRLSANTSASPSLSILSTSSSWRIWSTPAMAKRTSFLSTSVCTPARVTGSTWR